MQRGFFYFSEPADRSELAADSALASQSEPFFKRSSVLAVVVSGIIVDRRL